MSQDYELHGVHAGEQLHLGAFELCHLQCFVVWYGGSDLSRAGRVDEKIHVGASVGSTKRRVGRDLHRYGRFNKYIQIR